MTDILVCDFEIVLQGPGPMQPYPGVDEPTWYERDIEDILEVLREHGMGVVIEGPECRWGDRSKYNDVTATVIVRHAVPVKDVGDQRLSDELRAHGAYGEQEPKPIAARITRTAWAKLSYSRLKAMKLAPFAKAPLRAKDLVDRALIGRE